MGGGKVLDTYLKFCVYSWSSIFAVNVLKESTAKFETAKFIPKSNDREKNMTFKFFTMLKKLAMKVTLLLSSSHKSHYIHALLVRTKVVLK